MPKNLRYAFFEEDSKFEKVDVKREGVKFYRKQILKFGTWRHPKDRSIEFEITPEVAQQVANNFMAGIPVEAPIVLTHTDNPREKVGAIKKFEAAADGLYGWFSVADEKMNENIASSEKAPGVSCWLDMDYMDKQTNKSVGAVVKHVALVNHPYIEGLGGYEAVSLSEGKESEKFVPLVMSEKKNVLGGSDMPKLTEILASLKKEHKIDVVQLQDDLKILNKQVEDGELIKKSDVPVLSEELLKNIKVKLELSEDTSVEDTIKQFTSKFEEVLKLSDGKDKDKSELEELKKKNAATQLEMTEMKADAALKILVDATKILPAEVETLKKLYIKDEATFTELMKTRTAPLLELAEKGLKSDETPSAETKEKEAAYIKAQVELAEKEGLTPKSS